MIEIRHLQKTYTVDPVIKDISVTINDKEVVAIIGPSGCGKSTFVRCINMLETPSGGQIFLDGTEISDPSFDKTKIAHKIGMVFQSFNLFEHLTVVENIMAPQIDVLKRSRQEAYDKAMELLKKVDLSSKYLSYPSSLSGGQKQRIAIARTLAMDPEVILFDEPTSALDPTMVQEVQSVIRQLSRSDKTILIVTHDLSFARNIADRVLYMDEGTIYEQGTPEELFDHPKKEKTIDFINKRKTLTIEIDKQDHDLYDEITSIDSFCAKNRIEYKKSYHLQAIFEELCAGILLNELREPFIRFRIEYSEASEELHVDVFYGKERFVIDGSKNELSLSILKGFCDTIAYEEITEERYRNHLKIKVR